MNKTILVLFAALVLVLLVFLGVTVWNYNEAVSLGESAQEASIAETLSAWNQANQTSTSGTGFAFSKGETSATARFSRMFLRPRASACRLPA